MYNAEIEIESISYFYSNNQNDKVNAKKCYEQALMLRPQNPRAKENLEALKNWYPSVFWAYSWNIPLKECPFVAKPIRYWIGTNSAFWYWGVIIDLPQNVQNQQITPLLLLPLVENAFKHGIHACRQAAFLTLRITVENDVLMIFISNSKPNFVTNSLGMGIENVQRRLALLYSDKYGLTIYRCQVQSIILGSALFENQSVRNSNWSDFPFG